MATAVTDIEVPQPAPAPKRSPRLGRIGLAAVIAAVIATAGWFVFRPGSTGTAVPAINPAVESAWGVRPTRLVTSGDGGFIDLRFVVIDADKAVAMMQDVNNLPVLRVEGSGKVLNSVVAMSTRHDLAAGRTYFLLYRDDAGAIKRGTQVTILFHDGSKIEHAVAR
jgi:hypothetical protein